MTIYYKTDGSIDRVKTNACDIDGFTEAPGMDELDDTTQSGVMSWTAEQVAQFTQPGVSRVADFDPEWAELHKLSGDNT